MHPVHNEIPVLHNKTTLTTLVVINLKIGTSLATIAGILRNDILDIDQIVEAE